MKDVGTTYTMINKNASEEVKQAAIIANNVLVRDESTFDTSVAIGWYRSATRWRRPTNVNTSMRR